MQGVIASVDVTSVVYFDSMDFSGGTLSVVETRKDEGFSVKLILDVKKDGKSIQLCFSNVGDDYFMGDYFDWIATYEYSSKLEYVCVDGVYYNTKAIYASITEMPEVDIPSAKELLATIPGYIDEVSVVKEPAEEINTLISDLLEESNEFFKDQYRKTVNHTGSALLVFNDEFSKGLLIAESSYLPTTGLLPVIHNADIRINDKRILLVDVIIDYEDFDIISGDIYINGRKASYQE